MTPDETPPFNPPSILDPQGKPARTAANTICPNCGTGPEKRVASCGFGVPHPVCPCGHEFLGEVFRG